MLTNEEIGHYRNRNAGPISDEGWAEVEKTIASLKIGNLVWVGQYIDGSSKFYNLVKFVELKTDGRVNVARFITETGEKFSTYYYSVCRKATREEIDDLIREAHKKIAFYENSH